MEQNSGGMYIRKTNKIVKGKTYTNYLLVQSVMTPRGPRQKTVFSLGNLKPRPGSEWLRLANELEDALKGQKRLNGFDSEVEGIISDARAVPGRPRRSPRSATEIEEEIVSVHPDGVSFYRSRQAGPVHVGHQFWERLGLDEILREAGLSKDARVLTEAMTLNRLISPSSEHAMSAWICRTALDDILKVDFRRLNGDRLYRNMDKLYPARCEIENRLAERERSLFNLDDTIYLYDLTSTYFEGKALANTQAKLGYSRDKRPDCKQVVIGLVIDRDGFPKAHEVFDGNRTDRTTVGEMLDILEKRVGKREDATVVIDRGMACEENIREIKQRNLSYIIAGRQSERTQWLDEFECSQWKEIIRQPSPRNRFQRKTRVQIKKASSRDETVVLCISEGRQEKDRAIREKHEKRLMTDLGKLRLRIRKGQLKDQKKIYEAIGRLKERYPRIARYYTIDYIADIGELMSREDGVRKAIAEKLDGSYVLKTNRKDLGIEEIWRIYSLLTRAENAFRAMKSPLGERPVFHHLKHRVQTHIFLCVLAYHLLVSIEKTLLDRDIHTSWATLRDTLETHQVGTVVLPATNGDTLKIRRAGNPEKEHVEIYQSLGITSEVMKPIKTWIRRKHSD